ncbi:hypothetical protein BU15DRAFT_69079 [Melanogaster broomeanus]|nr:hypothetical protein BU15DRAFT_69079 [Melanogaster broomeanus]
MDVCIRYLGLSLATAESFSTVIYLFTTWGNMIYLSVTDLTLILRVYAMYNRSRIVLGIILLVYIPTVAVQFALIVMFNNFKTHLSVTEVEEMNLKFCVTSYSDATELSIYIWIARAVNSAVLCLFAVAQFIRHALEMHKVLGKWQSNRYMRFLVQESILYFISDLLYNVLGIVLGPSKTVSRTAAAPYLLAPRLIISAREFHSHIVGDHIDNGFGFSSQGFSRSHGIIWASPEDREGDGGVVEEVASTEIVVE